METEKISSPKMVFVSSPKPFNDEFGWVQNNAILSWKKRSSVSKIVLVGDKFSGESTKNYCEENDIIFESDVRCSDEGTPYVSSLMDLGYNNTNDDEVICFINTDIILLEDFDNTWNSIHSFVKDKTFLMIGQRWDWVKPKPVNFDSPNWENEATALAKNDGYLHEVCGIDYFIHHKTKFDDMPEFFIGKYVWDQWLVNKGNVEFDISVDLTKTIFSIHQECPRMNQGEVVPVDDNRLLSERNSAPNWFDDLPEVLHNRRLCGHLPLGNTNNTKFYSDLVDNKLIVYKR